jgi:7,8-dihydropterin-6-yl-methyl-4-(beta-D-ribofuranosyl)aminobenzene 5'-phosphate synthase
LTNLNLEEIKKLLKKYPLKKDREIVSKLLDGEKLSEKELVRAFHVSMPLFTLMVLHNRFERNKHFAENEWSSTKLKKLDDMGTVEQLEIVPLIDFHAEGEFFTEKGVSYYLKADDTGILFDTGLNPKEKHPSPLLKNMEYLGVNPEDFKYVFISHLHGDHVGGTKWVQKKTFSLSAAQVDLGHVKAFTPVPMNHPTATVSHVSYPEIIVKGIASIGPIRNPMYFFGEAIEQSLAINVKGKGIVIIVGCGHQGIHKIIDRVEALFDTPIYGIIGGLHLPIPEFPGDDITWAGLPIYKFVVTRRPPWQPWHKNDRDDTLDYLKARNPKLVALSPHDSSIESINAFRDTFKEAYVDLKVGKPIKIA